MRQDQKIVISLPVQELWAGPRLVSTLKVRDLKADDIVDMLRSDVVRFVVADVGKPLQWVPNNRRYDFWKDEAKAHLADSDKQIYIEDYPDDYCYFASEWKSYDGETIILLSKAH